uniref:Dirigent protein n=1 Tax=Aegilops tauschii subsp. strangulata TaxID=200361 RepID=A0A452XJ26_AEGTS
MAATNPSYYQSGACQEIRHKEHLFHLYMNQVFDGKLVTNANQLAIVTPGLPNSFGVTIANDWTILDGLGADANLVARARGMHMGVGKADMSWLFCHTILFADTSRFKGSSLKVLGDFVGDKDSEWAIVGGTGEFAYAEYSSPK